MQNGFEALVFISAGSNSGDRLFYLREALRLLNGGFFRVDAVSSVYESEPWGFEDPVSFYNICFSGYVTVNPPVLMRRLLEIEEILGRVRGNGTSYTSRTLDLDILFWDDLLIYSPELDIPHPRAHLRKFVLEPLSEIAPELVHPKFGLSVSELLRKCPDKGEIKKWGKIE